MSNQLTILFVLLPALNFLKNPLSTLLRDSSFMSTLFQESVLKRPSAAFRFGLRCLVTTPTAKSWFIFKEVCDIDEHNGEEGYSGR